MLRTPGGKPTSWASFDSVKSERGVGLGGLQNNGVTSGKGRANLPRKHEQRKVPGNNLATDTNGLSADVVKVARARVQQHHR